MSEFETKPKDMFEAQQRLVGRYGNLAIKHGPAPDISASPYLPSELDPFETMAMKCYGRFVQESKGTKSDAIRNGYMICGRILGYSVRAYQEFCIKGNRQNNINELINLLKSPQVYDELVKFLAKMPNEINRIFEESYSLVTAYYRGNGNYSPFRISENSNGELIIYPDEELEDQAYRQCPRAEKSYYGDYAYCPASEVLLPNLWQHMIDLVATEPDILHSERVIVS
ncbi:MAG: hypothetical protein AAB459_03165 [Patescibacteria group bacterium]